MYDLGEVFVPANPIGQEPEQALFSDFEPGIRTLPAGFQVAPRFQPLAVEIVFEKDVAVTLRDGVTIYVDVMRPAGSEKVPVIVAWSPYGKSTGNAPKYNAIFDMLGMTRGGDVPESKIRYWLEDYSVNGGYLQGKMPSPAEGIFVPAVKLGAVVKKDQLWGTITHPLKADQRELLADTNGIVLFLRTAPFVRPGESLGGILPIMNPGKLIINGK